MSMPLVTRPVHFRRIVEICYYNTMSFWTRRKCARRVKITLKYNSIFRRRVPNVHGALKADSTRPKYSRILSTLRKLVYSF